MTPASSTWPQLVLPQPENLHSWIAASEPLHATSSIQIRPLPKQEQSHRENTLRLTIRQTFWYRLGISQYIIVHFCVFETFVFLFGFFPNLVRSVPSCGPRWPLGIPTSCTQRRHPSCPTHHRTPSPSGARGRPPHGPRGDPTRSPVVPGCLPLRGQKMKCVRTGAIPHVRDICRRLTIVK